MISYLMEHRKKTGIRVFAIILCAFVLINVTGIPAFTIPVFAEEKNKEQKKEEKSSSQANVSLTAKSAVLMEGSTGSIIYEKEKDLELNPASITKIMTLLLIFEEMENGKLALTDEVTVSEHAASMGGSQVFLEPNETQTVDDMLKCISIASANDACVAMAEHIAGSEEEFVSRMNKRAKELGMKHTNFVNCCGLDVAGHYSTAYDVALMSRELILNHPDISKYSTTWMDKIIHKTRKGETEFGLSNTNKLVRTYDGITGLKTGSTSLAKFCLSATASKNDMDMIAVVMSAPDPKVRFLEAAKLLDYGFANCSMYVDNLENLKLKPVLVEKGLKDIVYGEVKEKFHYLCLKGVDQTQIKRKVSMNKKVMAPVKKGKKIGTITYMLGDKKIGTIPIVSKEKIKKAGYKDYLIKISNGFFVKK